MRARALRRVLVTGGAGFIGSNFIRYLLGQKDFEGSVVNVDALTYAGNLANVSEFQRERRYSFEHVDIRNLADVHRVFETHGIDTVVHLAAESHVDRSIVSPGDFISTNIVGTFNLLEAARVAWQDRSDVLFHHVSTDEVYGSLGSEGKFRENTPYDPRSPYSASKASSDHLVRAYGHTYGLPATISNCSNNYGPFQFPEKLIPLMVLSMLEGRALPIYGDGTNVRDWLYVRDHAAALWAILRSSPVGESWNVGGESEWRNVDLVHALCGLVAEETGRDQGGFLRLIQFVKDRPGHDRRYAIDCTKIKSGLGWRCDHDIRTGLRQTVAWYLSHMDWVDGVRTGEYRKWLGENYGMR